MSIKASTVGTEPVVVYEGVFGSTFQKGNENLFLRMEPLTEQNAPCWTRYKDNSTWVANDRMGVLSNLVSYAGKSIYPSHEQTKEQTGFTAEEHCAFEQKAIALKEATDGKITQLLQANSGGITYMCTTHKATKINYIAYITRDRNFSILKANDYMIQNGQTLKNYIEAYKSVLIAVGSDFTSKITFHNRGIARNPYWVFERKYSGLSMLLHGFTGAVAHEFFPLKQALYVQPIGSMQVIISKHLLPNEGFIELPSGKKDLVELDASVSDKELGRNVILMPALIRIFNQAMSAFTESRQPVVIRDGVFGASVTKDQEPLYLRMERLTEENASAWAHYKSNTMEIANQGRGILSYLVHMAERAIYPEHDEFEKETGFTVDEHRAFEQKAIRIIKATDGKITRVLRSNAIGIRCMDTDSHTDGMHYIAYASRTPDFSILNADQYIAQNGVTLKNYIEAYRNVLITIGTDFTVERSFGSRGISRNPYWVVEGKYSGLSMILHGFTGAVVDRFFPEKEEMRVSPIGSMQVIISKYLLPNEGYLEQFDGNTDLAELQASIFDGEHGTNVIKISALMRIYMQATSGA